MTTRESPFQKVLGIAEGTERESFAWTLHQTLNFAASGRHWALQRILEHNYDLLGLAGDARCFRGVAARFGHDRVQNPLLLSFEVPRETFRFLALEVRVRGWTEVPPDWSRHGAVSTVALTVDDDDKFQVLTTDGYGLYVGVRSERFAAMQAYCRWMIDADVERAGFHLADEVHMCQFMGDPAGAVDVLRLVRDLPAGSTHLLAMLEKELRSTSPAIRLAAAEAADLGRIPALSSSLRDAAIAETVPWIWRPMVRSLRCIGGEAAFDALLEVAENSTLGRTDPLASRALAWVPRYDRREARLERLCFSKHPKHQSIGGEAMTAAKYASIVDEGAPLATPEERAAQRAILD